MINKFYLYKYIYVSYSIKKTTKKTQIYELLNIIYLNYSGQNKEKMICQKLKYQNRLKLII